jgi:hypothetical protein
MKIKKITKKIKNKKNDVGRKSKINRRQINRHISNKKTMKGGNPMFDELSRKLLTKEILNENILKEIDRSPKGFKDYLIDKYYEIFLKKKRVDVNKRLEPLQAKHSWSQDIISLTEEAFNKIIKDVEPFIDYYEPFKTKIIILAPGDTPSKIVAFMNLTKKKYFEKIMEEYNISIVSFPMSKASEWNDETATQYIKEKIKEPLGQYGKEEYEMKNQVYFGILDAISGGTTIKKLNETLEALGYENLIHEPPSGRNLKDWHPQFGYNLLGSGYIYEGAELDILLEHCRCTPNYEVEKYKSKKIDEETFKNNLYNCNIYLYYWYCYWSENNNEGNGAAANEAAGKRAAAAGNGAAGNNNN